MDITTRIENKLQSTVRMTFVRDVIREPAELETKSFQMSLIIRTTGVTNQKTIGENGKSKWKGIRNETSSEIYILTERRWSYEQEQGLENT